ncbi:Phosphoribosylglycinamide formyltransferase [bioreactor metagenome]|uniref:Phosphoribosylglycinamide formyltransferase n=1 Tax=bioreactor metagenome TaxID=1076179 RepID=A0A645D7L7_9ZZZZ
MSGGAGGSAARIQTCVHTVFGHRAFLMIRNLFPGVAKRPARAALFMSGSGTNAEALLRYHAGNSGCSFIPALIVTDAPESGRAREIAATWKIPLAELDIRAFYAERGETAIALTSERRRAIRAEWTDALRRLIAPWKIDFGVLAGFVPLCNIAADIPCLNVHPGDLTLESGGRRLLAGLHFRPVETAILAGHPALRSSVILAQPFRGSGEAEMDSGPVLGVSVPVPVELDGESVASLAAADAARVRAPYRDRLREVAEANLERLKLRGDHAVLPRAADDFAAGRFGLDGGQLCFREDGYGWTPVRTVEYGPHGRRLLS